MSNAQQETSMDMTQSHLGHQHTMPNHSDRQLSLVNKLMILSSLLLLALIAMSSACAPIPTNADAKNKQKEFEENRVQQLKQKRYKVWQNKAPIVTSIAIDSGRSGVSADYNDLKVGQRILISGSDFISPKWGKAVVRLSGTFTPQGEQTPRSNNILPSFEFDTEYLNSGQIAINVFPNNIFDRGADGTIIGNRIGKITVGIQVINQPFDGSESKSSCSFDDANCHGFNATLGKSIIVHRASPRNNTCNEKNGVVTETIEDQEFRFEVEAIGFANTSDMNFSFYFNKEGWNTAEITDFGSTATNSIKHSGYFVVNIPDENSDGIVALESNGNSDTKNVIVGFFNAVPVIGGIVSAFDTVRDSADYVGGTSGENDIISGSNYKLKTRVVPKPQEESATTGNIFLNAGIHVTVSKTGTDFGRASLFVPMIVTLPVRSVPGSYHSTIVDYSDVLPARINGVTVGCQPNTQGINQERSFSTSFSSSISFDTGTDISTGGGWQLGFIKGIRQDLNSAFSDRQSSSQSQDLSVHLSGTALAGQRTQPHQQTQTIHHIYQIKQYDACGALPGHGSAWFTEQATSFALTMDYGECGGGPFLDIGLPPPGPCTENCALN